MNAKLLYPLFLLLGIFSLGLEPCAAVPTSSWEVAFTHKAGKSAIDLSGTANKQALSELDSIIARSHGRHISKIEVKSYSSPEGRTAWNTKLAAMRSSNVKSLLESKMAGMVYPEIVVNDVPEDWESAIAYLTAGDKQWKDEALKIIKSGDDVKGKLEDLWAGEAWDDLIWNCFSTVRRTVVIFNFDSNSEISELQNAADPDVISVKFAVGRTSIASSYKDNSSNLEKLSLLSKDLDQLKTVVLDAYASPEGRASWNLVLARRRAEAVKAYLVARGVPADKVQIRTGQEDWTGLKDMVEDNWFGSEKSDILDVLEDAQLSSDAREQKLRSISHGSVWNKMIVSWMADLRRVDIHLE